MAIDKILINASPGETRIALIKQGCLRELVVSRPSAPSFVGDIYLGRVEKVLPAINAAFVAIGQQLSGFMAAAEARPADDNAFGAIGGYVSEGDQILVQAQRDPFLDKGAKLTTRVFLPGRLLALTPGQRGIRASSRIKDQEEQSRLTSLVKGMVKDDEGLVIRARAAGSLEHELARDIQYLQGVWRKIKAAEKSARPPALLHRELDPLLQAIRDEGGPNIEKIVANDQRTFAAIKVFCEQVAPELASRLELHGGPSDLFEAHGVEEQIESALAPKVKLTSGGDIIIGETAALTAIDVNMGSAAQGGGHGSGHEKTALAVNLDAAFVIASQIRLRNISGLIVIDFISMKSRRHGEKALERLRLAVELDPCSVHVAGFTRLGLVEITRVRRRDSLVHVLCGPCPRCAGSGFVKSAQSVAFEALRTAIRTPGSSLAIHAAPPVIAALKGQAEAALKETETRLGQSLQLIADGTLPPDRFEVASGNG